MEWKLKYLDLLKRYNYNYDILLKGKVEGKYIIMNVIIY